MIGNAGAKVKASAIQGVVLPNIQCLPVLSKLDLKTESLVTGSVRFNSFAGMRMLMELSPGFDVAQAGRESSSWIEKRP